MLPSDKFKAVLPALDGEAPRTLVERAYLGLRRDIVCGKLAPGERLRAEHLKDQYEVGAATLREALSLLIGTVGLRSVLDDQQVVFFRKRDPLGRQDHLPEEMHWEQCTCF